MRQLIILFFLSLSMVLSAQTEKNSTVFEKFITPEILLGITAESNTDFPESSITSGIYLNIGNAHDNNPQEWAYRLGYPKTGVALGVIDYGNRDALGQAFTILPNAEFNILGREKRKFTMNVGLGASYFNKIFNAENNLLNQAVSTDLTWTFRLLFYYKVIETESVIWRMGAGYLHHSNGHTRLPNNGYNSILGSVSAQIATKKSVPITENNNIYFEKSSAYYFSPRVGLGANILSLVYNDKRKVYTAAFSVGKQFNRTFKLGIGLSYRFYEHYYDYIDWNESLVQEGMEFEALKQNPWWNASNIALFFEGEVLLNHIGISFQLGGNIHKPAYDIDWRINQGWDNPPRDFPDNWVFGEYNTKYKLKKYISSRLGLRYYLFGNENYPTHNVYAGASINANLGQADFTELSIGYVYLFSKQ